MGRPVYGSGGSRGDDTADAFLEFLHGACRFLLYAGAAVALLGTAGIIYYLILFSDSSAQANVAQALNLIDIASKLLLYGMVAFGVGGMVIFWGEAMLEAILVIIAAIYLFSPVYLPMLLGTAGDSQVRGAGLDALQQASTAIAVIAVITVVGDVAGRLRSRILHGIRSDNLKFGKGIKEELEKQNVFLGKCWQLPFCRKFVRERCPIYHSKRTCWKEKVGCMCDEKVIKNAMEGKMISRNPAEAARLIPINNKITMRQKMERCRQCVIYNERQKHKYKAAVPVTVLGYIGACALFWPLLMDAADSILHRVDALVQEAALNKSAAFVEKSLHGGFEWALLGCGLLIGLAYSLKIVEFLIFKIKV